MNLQLCPIINEYQNYNLRFIIIHSKNRYEYNLLDIACCFYGLTRFILYKIFKIKNK
jgi:hypothetical protein